MMSTTTASADPDYRVTMHGVSWGPSSVASAWLAGLGVTIAALLLLAALPSSPVRDFSGLETAGRAVPSLLLQDVRG